MQLAFSEQFVVFISNTYPNICSTEPSSAICYRHKLYAIAAKLRKPKLLGIFVHATPIMYLLRQRDTVTCIEGNSYHITAHCYGSEYFPCKLGMP
jgi:hypothetical protein